MEDFGVAFENLSDVEFLVALLHLLFAGGHYLLLVGEEVLVHHDGQERLYHGDADAVPVSLEREFRLLHVQLALLDFVVIVQSVEEGHAGVDTVIAVPAHGFLIVSEVETLCGRG